MSEFVHALAADGKWKVLSRVFVENEASSSCLPSTDSEKLGSTASTPGSTVCGEMASSSRGSLGLQRKMSSTI